MSPRIRHLAPILVAAIIPSIATAQTVAPDDQNPGITAVQPAAAAPAVAEPSSISVSGALSFQTDYLPRGFSLSDRKPVVQGYLEGAAPIVGSLKGFVGVFESSVGTDSGLGAEETDLYGGLTGPIGKATWRATYLRIVYPGAPGNINFNEFTASVSAPVGPVTLGATLLQDIYPVGDSTWIFGTAAYAIPRTPIVAKASLGWENGINWDNKINWSLGGFYTWHKLTFGATYVDTNKYLPDSTGTKNRAGATVLFSIGAAL